MKANTHDTGGEVQYGDHWGDPVRMGWTQTEMIAHTLMNLVINFL